MVGSFVHPLKAKTWGARNVLSNEHRTPVVAHAMIFGVEAAPDTDMAGNVVRFNQPFFPSKDEL